MHTTTSTAGLSRSDRRHGFAVVLLIVGVCIGGGCSTSGAHRTELATQHRPDLGATTQFCNAERLCQGYTIILPGILGPKKPECPIIRGLVDADVPSAVEVYDWTDGPGAFISNLRDLDRNRREARRVAAKIATYQACYPGRPVNLIGYSAGAGVAVLALEQLPPGHRVTRAIVMAPTLAPDYDLRKALYHTESGIHNYYSYGDVPALMLLTTALGTTDGRHTLAAGALGFKPPKGLQPLERKWYKQGVAQKHYSLDMLATGHVGGHLGWRNAKFVREHLAPLIAPPSSHDVQTVSFRSKR
jgi:pimeloyl-ACP methyl ester carboxylesterase